MGVDVLDRFLHAGDFLGVFVGNLDPELLFERHDELHRVQRIGAKVVHERRIGGHFLLIDAQLSREPRLQMLYQLTPKVLDMAAQAYAKDQKGAVNLLTQYASTNAVAWQRDWLALGDLLLGKYAMGMVDGQTVGYPSGWNDVIGYKPLVR